MRVPGLGLGMDGGTEEVRNEDEDEEEEFPTTEGDGEWGGEWWGVCGETASTKVECMVLMRRRERKGRGVVVVCSAWSRVTDGAFPP